MDTAAMVRRRRAAALPAQRLDEARRLVDRLADEHGAAPMIGRTLGQYAAADDVRQRHRALAWRARRSGDALRPRRDAPGPARWSGRRRLLLRGQCRRDRRRSRRAPRPRRPRRSVGDDAHADRPHRRRLGDSSAASSATSPRSVALTASDVGELSEHADGAGGSSSMAHKHNPVAAISARAAAMQLPGLAATLLHAAGGHDFERASGAWHAEWPALNALLRAGGAAVDWLATSLDRVAVDPNGWPPTWRGGEGAHHMTELAVVDTGDPDGPPVVWLGSLGSSTAMWDRQVAAFGDDPPLRPRRPPRPRRQPAGRRPAVDREHRRRVLAALDRMRRRRPRRLRRPLARGDGRDVDRRRAPGARRPSGAAVHERPLRLTGAVARAGGDRARRWDGCRRRNGRRSLADAGRTPPTTPTRSRRSWRWSARPTPRATPAAATRSGRWTCAAAAGDRRGDARRRRHARSGDPAALRRDDRRRHPRQPAGAGRRPPTSRTGNAPTRSTASSPPTSTGATMADDRYDAGMSVRREVLGDDHVDRATRGDHPVRRRLPTLHHRDGVGLDLDSRRAARPPHPLVRDDRPAHRPAPGARAGDARPRRPAQRPHPGRDRRGDHAHRRLRRHPRRQRGDRRRQGRPRRRG